MERWYGDGVTYDVFFDEEHVRFDVCALPEKSIVFSSSEFVEILHWCMRPEAPLEPSGSEPPNHAIDVSPPFDPEA